VTIFEQAMRLKRFELGRHKFTVEQGHTPGKLMDEESAWRLTADPMRFKPC
jgi:hypothetical protein